jgi:hypothetical protein
VWALARAVGVGCYGADGTASPQLRTRALQLVLLTDILDVIAALRGIQRHTLPPTGAVVTGGGAALFAGLGVAALAAQKRATT